MKIKYEFVNGDVSEVEVSDEIAAVITDSRRKEENLERKERYHCYSLDGAFYEGSDFEDKETPEMLIVRDEDKEVLHNAFSQLSETQQRRLLMLASGISINAIARIEGISSNAAWKSVRGAKNNFKKIKKKGV